MAAEFFNKHLQKYPTLHKGVREASHSEEMPFYGFGYEFKGQWYVHIDDSQWI